MDIEKLKKTTPARIGIGHAGSRYRTESMMDFLEAQAMASDAVFEEVSEETIKKLGVFEVKSRCRNKYDMLTRPDLGRFLDEEAINAIRENCVRNPQVQIYFGDGLCSPSIGANLPDLYPALKAELEYRGITVGTPFFVRYCRVNTARIVGPLVGATLTCVLIGERPGLLTSESMSAYMTVNAGPEMSESDYTVVSNISRMGMPPVEAAAYIADLMQELLNEYSGIKKNNENISQ